MKNLTLILLFALFGVSAAIPCFSQESNDLPEWKDTKGRTMTALYVSEKNEMVYFDRDGRKFAFPFSDLSPESQDLVRDSRKLAFRPQSHKTSGGRISVEHESFMELRLDAEKQARLLNKDGLTEYQKDAIRPGGRLVIRVEQSTIGAANTEWFSVIIFDADGNEVQRQDGKDDIANVPSGPDDLWWNHMIVRLEKHKHPITVRVINKLSNSAHEFLSVRQMDYHIGR